MDHTKFVSLQQFLSNSSLKVFISSHETHIFENFFAHSKSGQLLRESEYYISKKTHCAKNECQIWSRNLILTGNQRLCFSTKISHTKCYEHTPNFNSFQFNNKLKYQHPIWNILENNPFGTVQDQYEAARKNQNLLIDARVRYPWYVTKQTLKSTLKIAN